MLLQRSTHTTYYVKNAKRFFIRLKKFKISGMSNMKLQVITCKAAVCWRSGEAVKVEEIQVDPPKSTEIRVKVLSASLCHTDILCTRGLLPLFPRVLGHEGVGVIESLGEGVRDELKEGDLIIPTYLGQCRDCENCKSEKTNMCLKHPISLNGLMPDNTSRLSVRGEMLYHLFSCGTWSEYMVIDANYAVKIDPETPLAHASFLSCGFTTGFGAAWKDAKVEKGSSVAVLGLGAVGLGVLSGARVQGAAKIIGIDINDLKREKGPTFGMTDFINPSNSSESISALVTKLTNGSGVDYAFECTGVPSLINEALESTKMGTGTTIIIGGSSQPTVPINFIPLMMGRTLKGSIFGGIKIQSDIPAIADKCLNEQEINLDELLTHEITMEDLSTAFELCKEPECLKIVIKI